jgi:hypothetical protein
MEQTAAMRAGLSHREYDEIVGEFQGEINNISIEIENDEPHIVEILNIDTRIIGSNEVLYGFEIIAGVCNQYQVPILEITPNQFYNVRDLHNQRIMIFFKSIIYNNRTPEIVQSVEVCGFNHPECCGFYLFIQDA